VRATLFALIVLAGCRTRAVTTHYAGAPVGACQAGRAYQAPAMGSPTQPFVPLVASAPATTTTKASTDEVEPATDETADKTDNIEKPAAKAKKKPAKKSKKKEAP